MRYIDFVSGGEPASPFTERMMNRNAVSGTVPRRLAQPPKTPKCVFEIIPEYHPKNIGINGLKRSRIRVAYDSSQAVAIFKSVHISYVDVPCKTRQLRDDEIVELQRGWRFA